MAEENEDMLEELIMNLPIETDVDFQRLRASTRYSLVKRAARKNYMWAVESLLDRGCPINASETDHDSPLHLAVKSNLEQMVELLLEKGADFNSKNENGETPLLIAVERRNSKIVELLLKRGADVNVGLFSAIRKRNPRKVTALINSLKHNASSGLLGGYSPLRLAVETNHVRIVKLLLDRGYPVNASEAAPYSPLHLAVRNNSCEMVQLLLNYDADINAVSYERMTPLHFHSNYYEYGYPNLSVESETVILEIAKLLLNKGANINAQCQYGRTPLHWSTIRRLYSLADFLLGCNADVNLVDACGETALHFAAKVGGREIASSLLAKGADVNAKSSNGTTALHMAVECGYEKVVELLLANGAIVNCVDDDGGSPIHYLPQSGNAKAKKNGTLLLKWGADVNCKTAIGRTALHIAAGKIDVEVVKFLLENGAQVNCKDENGDSPLHRACIPKTIEILMEFGASVDCRDTEGRTPLHVNSALRCGLEVLTLLEYGADVNVKCKRDLTPLDWTRYSYDESLQDADLRKRFPHLEPWDPDVITELLTHQIKMESVGLYVEESQFHDRHAVHNQWIWENCQKEVVLLKREFINGTSISYYDFVRKDVRFLARYMNNEDVVRAADSEEYTSKFPEYASMIKSQFRRGRARKKLLESASPVLKQLVDLPDYCIEKIMDYLCDDDLTVLINVKDLATG